MQISGSPSLNTLQLNLTTDAQRASLLGKLSEGQTIQAHVLDELSTGRWAIRFMGHTLVAESRLALKPGQVVETRVQELGPPLMLSISGRPGSEDAAVRAGLHKLGLKDDATSRAVVAALIRNGLPVDRNEVQSLREFLAGLSNSTSLEDLDDLVDRILFLRGKGLPVTPDSLAAFWSSAPAGMLGALLDGLAGLLKNLAGRGVGNSRTRGVDELLQAISTQSGDLTAEDVHTLLTRLGIDLEGQLSRGQVGDSLRVVLLRLLESPDLTQAEADQVSNLLRFLNTVQAGALAGDDADPIVFQVPLLDGRNLTAADIRISRGGDEGCVDPSRFSVSIRVTLSNLGSIRIDLASYEGRNICAVRVGSQHAHDHVSREVDDLASALSRAGYPVPEVRVQLDEITVDDAIQPRIGVDFKA